MKNTFSFIIISLFRIIVLLFSKLSNKQIVKFTDFLVLLHVIFPNKLHNQFIINNSVIYPKESKKKINQLSKKNMFIALAALLFSLKYSSKKYKNDLDLKFETFGKDNLSDIKKDTSLICVAPHLGLNILTVKYFAKTLNRNCLLIMRQSWGNQKIETFIRKHYEDDKLRIVKLGGAMPEVKRTLNSGGIVILTIDAVLPIKYKHSINFFSKNFEFSTGPAWLAKKFSVPLITGFGTFDRDNMKINIRIDEPMSLENTIEKTTEKLAKRLEKYIYDNPGQWFQSDDYFGITGKKH